MALFVISYDLTEPAKNYGAVSRTLEAMGAKRVLMSEWVWEGSGTCEQLRDHMMRSMDSSDRLVVYEAIDWASRGTLANIPNVSRSGR